MGQIRLEFLLAQSIITNNICSAGKSTSVCTASF